MARRWAVPFAFAGHVAGAWPLGNWSASNLTPSHTLFDTQWPEVQQTHPTCSCACCITQMRNTERWSRVVAHTNATIRGCGPIYFGQPNTHEGFATCNVVVETEGQLCSREPGALEEISREHVVEVARFCFYECMPSTNRVYDIGIGEECIPVTPRAVEQKIHRQVIDNMTKAAAEKMAEDRAAERSWNEMPVVPFIEAAAQAAQQGLKNVFQNGDTGALREDLQNLPASSDWTITHEGYRTLRKGWFDRDAAFVSKKQELRVSSANGFLAAEHVSRQQGLQDTESEPPRSK